MKIILPNSAELKKTEGPGGYVRSQMPIDINQYVDSLMYYFIIIPKGKKVSEHYHKKAVEFFYLLSPQRVTLNEKDYNLPTGTLIITHPGDKHQFNADENDVQYLTFKAPSLPEDKVTV